MFKVNQKGISNIVILIIVIIGLIAGFYIVNYTQTNLKPKAASIPPLEIVKDTLLSKAEPPIDSDGNRVVLKSTEQGIGENPRFIVEYHPTVNDEFLLVIIDTPIEEVRQQAEEFILNEVNGNLQGLCELNFRIVAPGFVTGGDTATDNRLGICK